jgi:hypothetical protein
MNAALAQQIPAYVRRARAGDQNAQALLARVGQEARQGNRKAQPAYEALKSYIERNPAQPFQLGTENAVVMEGPAQLQSVQAVPPSRALARVPASDVVPASPRARVIAIERGKPPLPRGSLDKIFDPELFIPTVVRACAFRHGLQGAAVVLATGPLLTKKYVQEMALSHFGSDEASSCFAHGVANPSQEEWMAVAPALDPVLRKCFAVGQCVGRARKIQAVRMGACPISAYSEVAGWELGE